MNDGPPFDPGTAAPAPCRRNARPAPRRRNARPAPRPSHHSGWVREPGGPWRLVCRRVTWGECWAALIPVRTGSPAIEKVVREGDSHPDHRRKPR